MRLLSGLGWILIKFQSETVTKVQKVAYFKKTAPFINSIFIETFQNFQIRQQRNMLRPLNYGWKKKKCSRHIKWMTLLNWWCETAFKLFKNISEMVVIFISTSVYYKTWSFYFRQPSRKSYIKTQRKREKNNNRETLRQNFS